MSMLARRATRRLNIAPFGFAGPDVVADIRGKYGFDGDLLHFFAENQGALVHKWHHYIPLYDRYFSRLRGTPVKFLEVGVSKGGSLQVWRRYLGPQAIIFGIDIDPACAAFDGQAGQVRIGSQDDPAFLARVVAEMGGVDVVLDDGSHQMAHVRTTLTALFPQLSMGGLYVIEDLHTAYFDSFGGGYQDGRNFFQDLPKMIDDMHRWYHHQPDQAPYLGGALAGIHVHDSFVVLEKETPHAPVHSRVGAP